VKYVLAVIVAALVSVSTCAAAAPTVNLVGSFKPLLARIERSTKVPVLLPASFPTLDRLKAYATGTAGRTGWEIDLGFAPNCDSATACFLGDFSAKKGGSLPGRANAELADGDPVFFEPSTCGASCAPDSLWFVHDGVLYGSQDSDIPAKTPAKEFLINLANEAIAAGPR
jgi:hypothetical protein